MPNPKNCYFFNFLKYHQPYFIFINYKFQKGLNNLPSQAPPPISLVILLLSFIDGTPFLLRIPMN